MSGSDYNCIYIVPLCFNGRFLVMIAEHMLISDRQFMPHMRQHTVSNGRALGSTAGQSDFKQSAFMPQALQEYRDHLWDARRHGWEE